MDNPAHNQALVDELHSIRQRSIIRIVVSLIAFSAYLVLYFYSKTSAVDVAPRVLTFIQLGCVLLAALILPSSPRRPPAPMPEGENTISPEWIRYESLAKYGRIGLGFRISYVLALVGLYLMYG